MLIIIAKIILSCFIRDVEKEDVAFVQRFGSSILNRLWFHEQALVIVTEKLGEDHMLVKRFVSSTEAFRVLASKV